MSDVPLSDEALIYLQSVSLWVLAVAFLYVGTALLMSGRPR